MVENGLRVALVSLEPWDKIWRRNQHLSRALTNSGAVSDLTFVEPSTRQPHRRAPHHPLPRVRAVSTSFWLPKRAGGLREAGRRLRRLYTSEADVLWVNDPTVGVACIRRGQPTVYDVTDDWRTYNFPPRIIRRIVSAEDLLARTARTVVCSEALQHRWQQRYGQTPSIVHNGVDGEAWRAAVPLALPGPGPHVGYVGTIQSERLDIDVVQETADLPVVGTLHLIGPDALDVPSRQRLMSHPKVLLHGPVPGKDVPRWTKAFDVVIAPHLISPFTMSLDAIKSYEYLASGRAIVATATSGFHLLEKRPGVHVTAPDDFTQAVRRALIEPAPYPVIDENDWRTRSEQFARELRLAAMSTSSTGRP